MTRPITKRPFSSSSPWNVAIPSNPRIDAASGTMVGKVATRAAIADLYDYGTPIYAATSTTPKRSVRCTEPWGTCNLSSYPVPIPNGAAAAPGSDGQMVVIDAAANMVYEFWQYNNDYASCSWGDRLALSGSGMGSTAVGAGMSRLGGLVYCYEIERGYIDHALAFSTSYCDYKFRAPATKSDGKSGGVPEGARFQLDPTIAVRNIPGITKAESIIAKALQQYGMYCIDCGGSNCALQFENPVAEGQPNPYPGVGLGSDYQSLSHIPWSRMRVLATWNGT